VGLLFYGALQTVGRPNDVFQRPGSERTARFLGYNVVPGADGPEAVHPRDVRLGPDGAAGLELTVVSSGTVGREQLIVLRSDAGTRVEVRLPEATEELARGIRVTAQWGRSVRLTSVRLP
jgi:hypothetical protein